MNIELFNGNILVKELKREDKDSVGASGVFIPTEDLEDEQVSQGTVIRFSEGFNVGDRIMFHKTMPVDVHMKLDEDTELTNYFFINKQDVICRIS